MKGELVSACVLDAGRCNDLAVAERPEGRAPPKCLRIAALGTSWSQHSLAKSAKGRHRPASPRNPGRLFWADRHVVRGLLVQCCGAYPSLPHTLDQVRYSAVRANSKTAGEFFLSLFPLPPNQHRAHFSLSRSIFSSSIGCTRRHHLLCPSASTLSSTAPIGLDRP